MHKKRVVSGLLVLVTITLLTGCQMLPGGQSDTTQVALLLFGPLADTGWNATAYEGLQAAEEEFGIEGSLSEDVAVPDMEQAIRDYASQGYDLIIGHSNPFADPAMTVAEDYPDTWFVVTNGFVQAENVASFNLLEVESHYLAGVLAGLMTESNTIGVVGGVELPNLIANFNALEMGVESVNPGAEVVVSYVGDWGDPALGKETALAQIDGGADFIIDEAAGSGLGVLEACAEEDVPVISYVNLGDDAAPEQMVATLLPDFEGMIMDQVERYLEGDLEGQNYRPDLASGVIRLPMDGDVPDEVQSQVATAEESIVNGEIEVPEVFE